MILEFRDCMDWISGTEYNCRLIGPSETCGSEQRAYVLVDDLVAGPTCTESCEVGQQCFLSGAELFR